MYRIAVLSKEKLRQHWIHPVVMEYGCTVFSEINLASLLQTVRAAGPCLHGREHQGSKGASFNLSDSLVVGPSFLLFLLPVAGFWGEVVVARRVGVKHPYIKRMRLVAALPKNLAHGYPILQSPVCWQRCMTETLLLVAVALIQSLHWSTLPWRVLQWSLLSHCVSNN